MKRFCDSTLPCFFFIAEYNGGITPENIYLVHTGKELISRILKRLRENVAKNNTSINHITMNISYGKEDKITSFSGQALKEKIESHIKDGMNSYIKIKEKLLNELGYDKAPYEMKFQLDSPSDYTALVMSYLGYPKEIKISNVSSLENRFNIKLKNDELSQQKAMIELSNIKPTESGEIVLKSNGELLNFSCEYFLSPFIKSQKESDPILRVKCENFDMLISQGKSSNTKINFMHPKKLSNIFEVRDVILLQNMLFNNDGKIFIELHRENSLPMKFSINGQKSNGELDIKELQLLMLSINNLVQLAGKARIEKKLNLSISSLEKK